MRYFSTRTIASGFFAISLLMTSGAIAQAPATQDHNKGAATATSAPEQEVDPLKRPLSEKQKREQQKALKQELGKTYKVWLDQDVKWIITGEELQAFRQLSNDEERDQFIEQFWLRRDPTPDTVENEFKEEHYRRIAYANEHFASGIQGWRTDRGRTYVVWGPPDEIESHPSGGTYNRTIEEGGGTTSTYPFERWRYRYLDGVGQEVNIEFVDTCGCNDYRMTIDDQEKDALKWIPGAGPTTYEEMGMVTRSDRLMGNRNGRDRITNTSRMFDRLNIMAKLNAPPPVKFKDLEEVVTSKITYNLMPFDVRTDFVRVTGDTVLVPVTVQMKNKDITFVNKDGVQRGAVNIFGRVTTLTGRIAQTFEDTVARDIPEGLFERDVQFSSIYWKALPLRPGRYRIDIVLKDVHGDRKGTWSKGIYVPEYSEDKLASSTLILADLMERVSAKSVGAGNFVIGNTKVRPRVDAADGKPAAFKKDQKLNIWMQVYNLSVDEQTKKPSANIEYEVVNAQTNKSVFKMAETTDQLGNVGEQVTLEKTVALNNLDPGLYRLIVKINDNVSKQTINPSARFQVE